ncbi:Nej1p NDAI_0I02410 [Naumovozyma dairenensis CBS 421]|uniref:Uncharacterized protein n=1 Tax=Naumovozyma dairenensis (strain ATCC 10597 / BCRC 20456 / CBS 421 / NBRC 0211 / NRRL Y-12639) TaxID=1071378 RepID=G0WG98_NAUDC|nr:hypothetical protein NDAI_0I02410 [Naumovozyma dairenensis CBS 421]CCD26809.1 hypothetical protein NDAI_0I02410 [Naumovozyma dairenensis CBS 421]
MISHGQESQIQPTEDDDWSVCHIDSNEYFKLCSIFTSDDNDGLNITTFKLSFLAINDEECKLKKEEEEHSSSLQVVLSSIDIEKQCKEQGFNKESIIEILNESLIQIPNITLFQRQEVPTVLQFKINLSSIISLFLKTSKIKSLRSVEEIKLYSTLNKSILKKSQILLDQNTRLIKIINSKDKVIQFLYDSINDLGANKIIKSWAPRGSINYKAMNKFDQNDAMLNTRPNDNKSISIHDIAETLFNTTYNGKSLTLSSQPTVMSSSSSIASSRESSPVKREESSLPSSLLISPSKLSRLEDISPIKNNVSPSKKKRAFGRVRKGKD